MPDPALRPLLTVLADLAFARPGAVFLQGRRYWTIETLLAQARKDLAVPKMRRALSVPDYWWEEDEHGKAIIWRAISGGKEAVFAEAGSDVRTTGEV